MDKLDERNFVRAVDSAATITMANPERDRNEILASQLKAAGVPFKYAKLASAAFNKRCTIDFFNHTRDEDRDKDFQLCDPAAVEALMTGSGVEQESKKASFVFSVVSAGNNGFKKSASAVSERKRIPLEDRVSYDTYMEIIDHNLEKLAAMGAKLKTDLEIEERELGALLTKISTQVENSEKDKQTLLNAYGSAFQQLMQDYIPGVQDMRKTAAYAVLPDRGVYRDVKEAFAKAEHLGLHKEAAIMVAEGAQEYAKGADRMQRLYHSLKRDNFLEKFAANGNNSGPQNPDVSDVIGGLADASLDTSAGMVQGYMSGLDQAARRGMNTINSLYAGIDRGYYPHKFLDAELLTKDRYMDRLMAWSDMTADPLFASYPSEQVFAAAKKVMDTDPTLERPDRREMLRSYVGQILAQNNRMSTADIASLATTLKALSSAEGSIAEEGSRAVGLLKKKIPNSTFKLDIGEAPNILSQDIHIPLMASLASSTGNAPAGGNTRGRNNNQGNNQGRARGNQGNNQGGNNIGNGNNNPLPPPSPNVHGPIFSDYEVIDWYSRYGDYLSGLNKDLDRMEAKGRKADPSYEVDPNYIQSLIDEAIRSDHNRHLLSRYNDITNSNAEAVYDPDTGRFILR